MGVIWLLRRRMVWSIQNSCGEGLEVDREVATTNGQLWVVSTVLSIWNYQSIASTAEKVALLLYSEIKSSLVTVDMPIMMPDHKWRYVLTRGVLLLLSRRQISQGLNWTGGLNLEVKGSSGWNLSNWPTTSAISKLAHVEIDLFLYIYHGTDNQRKIQ